MSRLKSAFEKSRVLGPLHTGGPVTVTSDGQRIFTCVGEEVLLTNVVDGQELCRFVADNETIHSLCLTPSASHLIVFTASLALHIYDEPLDFGGSIRAVRPSRSIQKSHEGPVHVCTSDPTSSLLASGSADGVVKVWDIRRGYVTHAFKGHGGVVSLLNFRYIHDVSSAINIEPTVQLVTGSVDTRLRIFDLGSRSSGGKPQAVLEGHVSVPRAVDITPDGRWMISAGRDSVVLIWEFPSPTPNEVSSQKGKGKVGVAPKLIKTIPVLERVEAAGLLPNDLITSYPGTSSSRDAIHFFTAGEKGVIKIWDGRRGVVLLALNDLTSSSEDMEIQREVIEARFIPSLSTVFSVHADHNILFHSLVSRSLTRQLIGFNDEIIDACFLSAATTDSHIAIAANSSLIRVYSTSDNDARLLSGHTAMLLCLGKSSNGTLLASGSKDRSARVWSFDPAGQEWSCIAICEGHAESIGALAIAKKAGAPDAPTDARFMFTGSQDRTIKMWDISGLPFSKLPGEQPHKCKSLTTHKAHEKDINSLDISPNDMLLASGSQDRTAKIYEIVYSTGSSGSRGDLKLLGTCKGHKRGVWVVRFGKFEKVLATGSGDKSIKLWNLDDFSCVKTFEGHTNSVLRVEFLNQDMQLASSASDGLLKLWNVRLEECVATMDNHEDKVWALATSNDESTIVTGAGDSIVTFWKDCTEEKQRMQESEREQAVLKDQDFVNYVSLKDYRNAISLALAMNQPRRLLALFKSIADECGSESEADSIIGNSNVDDVIRNLPATEVAKLFNHIRTWNANAKTSAVAQAILHALFKLRTTEDISVALSSTVHQSESSTANPREAESLNEVVQGLTPYTERHLARLDRLVQDSYILDYVLGEMDGGMLNGGEEIMVQ